MLQHATSQYYLCIYLFICNLTFNISDTENQSKRWLIKNNRKEYGRKQCVLSWGTIYLSVCPRNYWEPRNSSHYSRGLLLDIWTRDLPRNKHKCHPPNRDVRWVVFELRPTQNWKSSAQARLTGVTLTEKLLRRDGVRLSFTIWF